MKPWYHIIDYLLIFQKIQNFLLSLATEVIILGHNSSEILKNKHFSNNFINLKKLQSMYK